MSGMKCQPALTQCNEGGVTVNDRPTGRLTQQADLAYL